MSHVDDETTFAPGLVPMLKRYSSPLLAAALLAACTAHVPARGPAIREPVKADHAAAPTPPPAVAQPTAPPPPTGPALGERSAVQNFIGSVAGRRGLSAADLNRVFASAYSQPGVLAAIAKPYEAKPWYEYRKLFLTDTRVKNGRDFLQRNAAAFARAEQRYGVPREMLAAIIGIESSYGSNPGKYRVVESLATLGFDYPKRASFFLKELEEFLVLCRNEGIDPIKPMGSYAGAMGMPQFMPSSFRGYAADGDGDGKRDIWNNPADAIASVAKYFAANGWKSGGRIASHANVEGGSYRALLSRNVKPSHSLSQLAEHGVTPDGASAGDSAAALIELAGESGPDYWLGFHNFYVITRYNHSPLYAMAAYQLSEQLGQ